MAVSKQHLLTIAEQLAKTPDRAAMEFAHHWAVKYKGKVYQ